MSDEYNTVTAGGATQEDVAALHQQLIDSGVNVSDARFQDKVAGIRRKARQQAAQDERERAREQSRLARWTAGSVQNALRLVAASFTILVLAAGLSVGTALFLYAEYLATREGLALMDAELASTYAAAIVAFMVVVLMVREIIAQDNDAAPEREFSLRWVADWVLYVLFGIGGARYKATTPLLNKANRAVLWLMRTVIIFGLLGRLRLILDAMPDVPWYNGLAYIVTSSNLPTMGGHAGVLVMTVAMLMGTEFIVYLIYQIVYRMTGGGIDALDFSSGVDADAIEAEMLAAYYRVALKRQQDRVIAGRAKAPPTLASRATPNREAPTRATDFWLTGQEMDDTEPAEAVSTTSK